MKKRIRSKKLISSLAISTLVLGLFVTTVINADESEVTNEPEIQEVEEITEEEIVDEEQEVVEEGTVDEAEEVTESDITPTSEVEQIDRSSLARVDLTADAFLESSKPLHDAIVAKYGTLIDTDNNKTISIGEANAYTGQLILNDMEITGTIQGIENFTKTTHLLLYGNQLIGTIPENIGDMKSLINLHLKNNSLTGTIPESIGDLTNLGVLNLDSNQLSGAIPESIGNLENLTDLSLGINQLSGTIPESIGNLVNLKSLVLYMNQLSGSVPTSISNLENLTTLHYSYNDIDTANLSGLSKLQILSISGKAENADLTNVYNFFITKDKDLTGQVVRLVGTAGFATWDPTSTYYVINSGNSVTYTITYGVIIDGRLHMIVSDSIDLSQGGLMDNVGNLILGADLNDIVDGQVVLPDGGTVVTGNATYTFDGNTVVSETGIITEGNITTEKHVTDGTTVDLVGITTETNNSNGDTITIDLSDTKGTTTLKPGSIVTNNSGDKVYISDEATMDNEGNITSSGTYVTVSSDETETTNSDGTITLPENSTVTVNGEDTTYPGTIIFSPEDGSLKYIPVSELLNDDKTDLGTGITQTEIDDARTLVDGLADGNLKDQLTEIVDTAQNILNAKNAVEDLFTDGTHTAIPDDLTQADINNAQDLVDKIPDGTLKDELQKEINKAQDMLNAKDKVDELFTDGSHVDIIDGLTQGNIDDAQKAVDKLPNGSLKDELQTEIDKAQNMLDAKDKVDNLFTDETHTDITDGLTQKDIDKAQDAVDKLPNGDLKDELQKEIDKAQDMLNAKDAVGDLLDKDGNLNSGVTQEDIDNAQDLVNKLPDGKLKDDLQAIIDEAQRQLDAKNPSTAPVTNKPNLAATSTTGGSNVNTADTTNTSLYLGLLAVSLGGVVLIKRRKKETE